jgi:hypothetical protein
MLDKDQVLARALKYNSPTGRTITALKQVFNCVYPVNTNLVVEFLRLMIGLPYKDDGKSMDTSTDCSQLVINTLYYFFGIDYLGSYTQSIYNACLNRGKKYSTIGEAPILSIVEWKLSNRNPNATHAALKASGIEIADTRSKSRPLMFRLFAGWNVNKITLVCDLLTDEQRESVIVGDDVQPVKTTWTCSRVLKLRSKGEDVYNLELALEALGYNCGITKTERATKIGIWGSKCRSAFRDWQKKNPECGTKGKPDGQAGEKSITKLGGLWTGK